MKTNTRHWAAITAGILSLAGYASAATIGSEKYTYDASGNIIEKSIDGVVTKMAYDQANRLIGRQTTGQGDQTTAYDAAGRPVTERNADGQTTRSLSYGYGDKVLETQTQDSQAGFYYNAAGQLVGKNVGGNVSTYTWDGNVLAAEGAEAFANEAHVSGGVPVLASGRDVVVSDHLGNTLSQGNHDFASTAFGEGLEGGRFTGKSFVKELDSFVFQYRNYSSILSRWKAPDPSGYPDGGNNYSYVNGAPTGNVDPLGLTIVNYWLIPVDPGLSPGSWTGAACSVYVNVESEYNVDASYHSAVVQPGSQVFPSGKSFWYDSAASGLLEAPFELEDKTENGVRSTRSKTGIKAYATVHEFNSSKTLMGQLADPGYDFTTWIPEQ